MSLSRQNSFSSNSSSGSDFDDYFNRIQISPRTYKGELFYYDGIPDEELHYHLNTAFEAVVNSNNVVLLFHPKIFFMMKEEIISF